MAAPFKDVKVWTDGGEVAAQRPMTVQDLLRHTAGLPYGELTQNAAVKDALAKAGLFKPGVIEFDVRDMTAPSRSRGWRRFPCRINPARRGNTVSPSTCSAGWWKPHPASGLGSSWPSVCSLRSG
jgi:hypothetical protein